MHRSTYGSPSITALEPETPSPSPGLPVRIRVSGDLTRRRITVFFRLFLAIPHFIWLSIWGIAVAVVAIINWFAVLFTAQTPAGIHRFLTSYINYATHVYAYLSIAANRYPGFVGDPGYEVDIEFDPPARQNRWTVAFRIVLVIPVLILIAVLAGSGIGGGNYSSRSGNSSSASFQVAGVLSTTAVLSWFYALFRGRAPEGVVRLSQFALHFAAQAYAYVLVLTDRYPSPDPVVLGVPRRPPPHPIALIGRDDLVRSRVTVFFRLALAFPHLVWLTLWTVLVLILAFVNWLVTLVRGRSPSAFHRFFSAYQRYQIHVSAFLMLIANPFPGFVGAAGSYPVDLEIAPPARQRRWGVAFRGVLAFPAFLLNQALGVALYASAFLAWFAALFTGRTPRGLRNLGALALRYGAQTTSYGLLLLTSRYPYAGPPATGQSLPEDLAAPEPPPPPAPEPRIAPELADDDPRRGWIAPPFVEPPETGS